uniref:3-hydroxyacyl-CoA dehydrogenase n=1 Tax=Chlamydomonas euryale TaxID=1486919 RepID=A0A7R9VSF7_9CHLO|mmetsp:Transcript_43085/g.129381  ORF Transcript_43085/g.129381 Transcript_43085/m.129381 type:complete len:717 (+) Transcript_43085:317-2467(+)
MASTKMEVGPDGVAVITLCYPPLNALHPDLLRSLFRHLSEAHGDGRVKAVVVIGSNNNFSPGFDIQQFRKGSGGGGIDGSINDAICAVLEGGAKPTVAAINGVALGGGLEVAMGCNARVCTPGTRLGLPELQLGIIPGFGGTQRLPRLVGLQKAVEMMLTSTPIKAPAAAKLGLVDEVVPLEQLLDAAKHHALDIAEGRRPRNLSLVRTDRLEPLAEAMAILDFSRAQASKRARNLQHPHLCLDAIQVGVTDGGIAGLKAEGAAFAAAAALDTHKALVHIFFAQRSTKKVRGVTDAGLSPRKIKCVAVLGGGLMGSGIVTALVLNGVDAILKEIKQPFLEAGMGRVRANLASRVKKGAMTQADADAAMARVTGTLDYSHFKRADMVIEAALEDIGLKQKIFVELEGACRPDCILTTNTSTIDINLVGAKTRAQDRVLGAHFFSPAHIMPLLEIVKTEHTSAQVLLDTLALSSVIKKTPVVVGNCTGFAVNRVFFPYTMAACMLVDMGADPLLIDKVILGFGMPMGPFRLSDLVGSDIGMHVGKNFVESFSDRVYVSQLIPLLNQHKRLGEKTGSGFYKYDAKRRASPDAELLPLIDESRRSAGLAMPGKPPALSPKDIVDFIFLPVINEGCRVVAEGIVDKPEDLDVASVMSFGFPAYRVGYAVPRERAGGCAGLRADIASDAAWWTIKAEFSPQQKCALCTPRVSGTVFAREKVS